MSSDRLMSSLLTTDDVIIIVNLTDINIGLSDCAGSNIAVICYGISHTCACMCTHTYITHTCVHLHTHTRTQFK